MRQFLNTLYVTSPNSFVRRDGTNIVVEVEGKEAGRIPIHNIQQLMCFGYSGASAGAMYLCAENNVSLSFLTPSGKFLATVSGETKGNVLLRRAQYRRADNEAGSLEVSKNMIKGKIINCRTVLQKGLSNHSDKIDSASVKNGIEHLSSSLKAIDLVETSGTLRGIEGDAAKAYFDALDVLILRNKNAFFMNERTRRPPLDRFNALLSFIYSMLTNDVKSSLEAVGLDPYVGFLHTDRPGRPSLALDLMEEFRPLADRIALRLVNLGMVSADGFIEEGGGAFMMDDDTRATVIGEWQRIKSNEVYHSFLKESIQLGIIPFVQSSLLARFLRGDLVGYPPYVIRQAKP